MQKDVFSSNEFTSSSTDPVLVDAGSLTYRLVGFTASHANTKFPLPLFASFILLLFQELIAIGLWDG